jgi:hypothetical protein
MGNFQHFPPPCLTNSPQHGEATTILTQGPFLPHEDYYTGEKTLVIDFKDGIYAKAKIYNSNRLGDECQTDMVIIDAGYSLATMSQPNS